MPPGTSANPSSISQVRGFQERRFRPMSGTWTRPWKASQTASCHFPFKNSERTCPATVRSTTSSWMSETLHPRDARVNMYYHWRWNLMPEKVKLEHATPRGAGMPKGVLHWYSGPVRRSHARMKATPEIRLTQATRPSWTTPRRRWPALAEATSVTNATETSNTFRF